MKPKLEQKLLSLLSKNQGSITTAESCTGGLVAANVCDISGISAYFEEGYALGVGKPVIQLCQKDQRLHFDIAQKNTIMWDTEESIPAQLTNRIKATID